MSRTERIERVAVIGSGLMGHGIAQVFAEDGVATPEEIDKAVWGSLSLRLATIGHLRTIDLAGIDVLWFGMRDIYKYLDNSPDLRQIIHEMVKTGHFGSKLGKGLFEYRSDRLVTTEERNRDEESIRLLRILYPKAGTNNV